MPPVTCYICGRDFGTKSVGIHLSSCKKKWDAEQEKLPRKERRQVPTAPQDFDKVVKGEFKGKDLAKINQKAFDEHNESALGSCQFCGRTFKPQSLASHHKACTEEKPMVKNKGPGHASQLKAKVNYPKLKSKGSYNNLTAKQEKKTYNKIKEEPKVSEVEVKKENIDTFNLIEKVPTSGKAKPPLLAGGSSKVHGVFAYFQKDVKDNTKTGAGNDDTMNDAKEEDDNSYAQNDSSTNTSTTNPHVINPPNRSSDEEAQNLSEEEWILVNPQATREFMDDMKQKILQCVTSSSSTGESIEEEESEQQGDKDEEFDKEGNMEKLQEDLEEEQEAVLKEEEYEDDLTEKLQDGEIEKLEAESETEEQQKQDQEEPGAPVTKLTEAFDSCTTVEFVGEVITSKQNDDSADEDTIPTLIVSGENNELDEIMSYNSENIEEEEDETPKRKDIIEYLIGEPLYDEEEHRVKIMELISSYVKNVKKQKILDILDTHAFEDDDSVEDAVFLMSEILYSK